MNQSLITADQAIEGLRLAVAERGHGYIDPGAEGGRDDCRYVVLDEAGDMPGCIAGTALFKVGVPLSELRQWEGNTVDSMIPAVKTWPTTGYGNMTDADGFLTREAGSVLMKAQSIQDAGAPWGAALGAAEAKYREIKEECGD